MKVIIVSGGFDPIHSGHISYLKAAKKLADHLVVAVNSDAWLVKKKGKAFMPMEERMEIIKNISCVDEVIDFVDDELGSAVNAIKKVKTLYPNDEIIFANGGDRSKDNIPEGILSGVKFLFGVGGEEKKNSSSWILKKWNQETVERSWGKYIILLKDHGVVVKELIVKPNQGMSFQRHFHRNEIWLVSSGSCVVNYGPKEKENRKNIQLNRHDSFDINIEDWHQITNPFENECKIIEIQYGDLIDEEDIERLDYFKPE